MSHTLKVISFFVGNILAFVLLTGFSGANYGTAPARIMGWAVYTENGNVMRCSVGSEPEVLYRGKAAHATWSVDGKYIYFIERDGHLRRINNDGTGESFIVTLKNTKENPIAAYRPDPESVLYVNKRAFFRIRSDSGEMEKIFESTKTKGYTGEIAISHDGSRLAGRDQETDLYVIAIGESEQKYDPGCSSSISPDGRWLSANVVGHKTMKVYQADGTLKLASTQHVSHGHTWDNQRFAVNSGDYIVFNYDHEPGIGINHVPSDQNMLVCNGKSDHPDFFLGDLPVVNDKPTTGDKNESSNQPPHIEQLTTDPFPMVLEGESVTVACTAADPDGDSLTYQWQASNGETAEGQNVALEFDTAGVYEVTVRVTDPAGSFAVRTTQVRVSAPDQIRVEAEEMALDGYEPEDDIVALVRNTGVAMVRFRGPPGRYNVEAGIVAETAGETRLQFCIADVCNESAVHQKTRTGIRRTTVNLGMAHLENGTQIIVKGFRSGNAGARVDYLQFFSESKPNVQEFRNTASKHLSGEDKTESESAIGTPHAVGGCSATALPASVGPWLLLMIVGLRTGTRRHHRSLP